MVAKYLYCSTGRMNAALPPTYHLPPSLTPFPCTHQHINNAKLCTYGELMKCMLWLVFRLTETRPSSQLSPTFICLIIYTKVFRIIVTLCGRNSSYSNFWQFSHRLCHRGNVEKTEICKNFLKVAMYKSTCQRSDFRAYERGLEPQEKKKILQN